LTVDISSWKNSFFSELEESTGEIQAENEFTYHFHHLSFELGEVNSFEEFDHFFYLSIARGLTSPKHGSLVIFSKGSCPSNYKKFGWTGFARIMN